MTDEISMLEWVLGVEGAIAAGAFMYLMNTAIKNSDAIDINDKSLAAHKTHVAETYLTKNEFSETARRLEGRIESGNKANLESNEKIRTEMNANQGTLINLIANIKGSS